MPRTGRIVVLGYPHHIVQRGHNRRAIFAEPTDYANYLDSIRDFKRHYGVRVYAYCLMTNHVHLLLAPESGKGLGGFMKRVAGRQTRYVNRLEGRTGTLWEGRYKSSLVQSDAYLLACVRYIELNPVRARIVDDPACYEWSSCAHHLGRSYVEWLDDDPYYLGMGMDRAARAAAYEQFMADAVPTDEWTVIRESLQRGQLTGSRAFEAEIGAMIGKRIERRGQGRPRCRMESTGGTAGSRARDQRKINLSPF